MSNMSKVMKWIKKRLAKQNNKSDDLPPPYESALPRYSFIEDEIFRNN